MTSCRSSSLFAAVITGLLLLLLLLLLHAGYRTGYDRARLQGSAELVRTLGLSDLCLFTEASYTRHLSQADLRTPFQEYPLALEHFPSGSLVPPPSHLTDTHAPHH